MDLSVYENMDVSTLKDWLSLGKQMKSQYLITLFSILIEDRKRKYGGSSSIGGAPDCGSGGCEFEPRLSPQ